MVESFPSKKISQIVFPSLSYFQMVLGESQQVQSKWNLTVTNYVKSVQIKMKPKNFINPRLCIRGFTHACSIRSNNSTSQWGGKYGQVNHYRNMCLKTGKFKKTPETCKSYLNDMRENNVIAKFVTQKFHDRVRSVQRSLNI